MSCCQVVGFEKEYNHQYIQAPYTELKVARPDFEVYLEIAPSPGSEVVTRMRP